MCATVMLLLLACDNAWAEMSKEYHCDLIEINHVYGPPRGDLIFTQVIAWQRHARTGKLHAQGFRIVQAHHEQAPHRSATLYRMSIDGITLVSPLFRESWSNEDPEVVDKRKNPSIERQSPWIRLSLVPSLVSDTGR